MRLVCPNCSAQYEIDGSMIPDEGRDVQCSNCGHTWFELAGPSAAEPVAEQSAKVEETTQTDEDEFDMPASYDIDDDGSFEDDPQDEPPSGRLKSSAPDFISRADFEDDGVEPSSAFAGWDDEPEPALVAPDRREPEAEPESSFTAEEETSHSPVADTALEFETPSEPETELATEDEPEPEQTTFVGTPRRPADAAALDILREEAEREMSQRRALPPEALETQADLGLDDIRNRRTPSRALRARMAHLGEEMPEEPDKPESARQDGDAFSRLISTPTPAPRPQSETAEDAYEEPRRDLLPDIDEINSTLRREKGAEQEEAVKRSGFRTGFLIVLFLTVAAVFAYAQAPAIARALPQAEPTMISYVDWANGVRDWVDSLISD